MNDRDVLGEDVRAGFDLLRLIRDAWAVSLEVFLHHRFGEKYLWGIHAVFGLFVMFGIILCNPYADGRPMVIVIGAYLFLLLILRVETVGIGRRGQYVHSYYNGTPWLMSLWGFSKMDEVKVKGAEGGVLVLAGLLLLPINAPLGLYLGMGAFCLCMKIDAQEKQVREEVKRVQDALFERRMIAEQLRDSQRRRN